KGRHLPPLFSCSFWEPPPELPPPRGEGRGGGGDGPLHYWCRPPANTQPTTVTLGPNPRALHFSNSGPPQPASNYSPLGSSPRVMSRGGHKRGHSSPSRLGS